LSTFVFEPIRWNARFGWRPMCEQERLGMFYFWREVGRRMNLKDLPADSAAFERFNVEYEKAHYRFADRKPRVVGGARALFVRWFPRVLSPLVRRAIYAMLDDPLLEAFGFPRPSPWMRRLVAGSLRLRSWLARRLPARRRPRLRTEMKRALYPAGYRIEEL